MRTQTIERPTKTTSDRPRGRRVFVVKMPRNPGKATVINLT